MASPANAPILPGYYPDPSICRVGNRYYLTNSSFEYFPGLPLHASFDLLTWEPIGNALDRPEQLPVQTGEAGASGGIYAPTIRHHDGRFWLATTNIHEVRRGHLIVWAADPAGPWSDPVYTTGAFGIDPDLAWDEHGICRLTWHDVMRGGISQVPVNPETGELLGEPKVIWRGTGGSNPEGPHVYQRGGWWYLLIAEGGTGTGHMVTVARSRNIDDPYESNPANPILTHRSTNDPVQATGHGDLVELTDGSWAMVHLGTRPRGSFPRWHTNGRETFLVGINWRHDDGAICICIEPDAESGDCPGAWPTVDEGRFVVPERLSSFTDRFTGERLHPRWISPGAAPATFATTGQGGLTLTQGRAAAERDAACLLATRVTDLYWSATVAASGDLALVVRVDDAHQALVQRIGETITARASIGPLTQELGAGLVPPEASLTIRAETTGAAPGQRSGPDRLRLGFEVSGEFTELATLDGRYISTEVAGGFTGRTIGLEALSPQAQVQAFTYTAL
ncbi:MAG: glycoside hydrolase family 43 protein [Promicromonosporaceae bacterium]|nr:glycoside hydrolase family 43 protein [Promicromonosporaceae bacterium]